MCPYKPTKRLKHFPKPLSVPDQIRNLKSLGLIIDDQRDAEDVLNIISYYRLIKPYGNLFKSQGRFIPGTTFTDILDLYYFDDHLRSTVLNTLLAFEVRLRCRISNYFSLKYGNLGYLERSSYADESDQWDSGHREAVDQMVEHCRKIISDKYASGNPIICHFIDEYAEHNPPFYAFIEVLSFGQLANLFRYMKQEDQAEIAKTFNNNLPRYYMVNWVAAISEMRNICAHNNRLYKKAFRLKLRFLETDRNQEVDADSLFGFLFTIRHLFKNEFDMWTQLINDLVDIIHNRPDSVELEHLGFVGNWKQLLLDQYPDNPLLSVFQRESIDA